MNSDKNKERENPTETSVPFDLTRLKSWSDFNETDYRDFSQQRAERRSSAHRRLEETRKVHVEASAPTAPPPAPVPVAGPMLGAATAAGIRLPAAALPPLPEPPRLTAEQAHAPLLTPPESVIPRREPASAVPGQRAAIAVFSLAGGVGKSTLCAHLARSLYTSGERVLLADATGQSPLSHYFGSDEEREGLRQFCAPGEKHASVLVCHTESPDADWLRDQIQPLIEIADRTIFDLGKANLALIEQVVGLCQIVLVPVIPGSHALYGVQRVLALLARLRSTLAAMPQVYFVLNQIEGSPEAEQALRASIASLGAENFAPVTLCHSEDVGNAFAERMTLGDYHPSDPLAQQFERLATWLRRTVPPSQPARARRWSEV